MTLLATETVWQEFHLRLRQFVRAHIADEMAVDDVVQEIFLCLHQQLPTLRHQEKLTSWLFQIARHAIADHYRQRRVDPLPANAADILVAPTPAPPDIYLALAPCVRGLLPCLAASDQEALTLTEFAGVRQVALAQRWGISVSGAKSRVQRARARLRMLLVQACHVELDRRGLPIALLPGCVGCAQSCAPPASFSPVHRLWSEPTNEVGTTTDFMRSATMSTPETTTTTTSPTGGFKQPVIIPLAMTSTGCCGAPATDGGACCGEPVQAVTDATVSGTASCCGDTSASSGGCCN